MVELKKKEAECLEAPQERGNATSPGSHPCVRDEGREREGTHYQSEDTARLPKHRRVLFMVPHAVFLSALLASTPIPSNSLLFSSLSHSNMDSQFIRVNPCALVQFLGIVLACL